MAADASGNPFGVADKQQNDHIDSLAEFNGYLYASTANRSGSILGTRVFRSSTGAPPWSDAIAAHGGAGFGDVNNGNFKDMIVFTVGGTDWLCGGTGNDTAGAQVWCTSDGTTWTQKNTSGFGDANNTLITSSAVFNAALYFGVVDTAGTGTPQGSVWRTVVHGCRGGVVQRPVPARRLAQAVTLAPVRLAGVVEMIVERMASEILAARSCSSA